MEIRRSTQDGCMVITFTGSIDMLTVSRVRRALLKDLSEEPFALICDLAGVDHLDPVCATVFVTVANHPSSLWPATSFLLVAPSRRWPRPWAGSGAALPAAVRRVTRAVDEAVARPPYLRDELGWPRPRRPRRRPGPSCGRSAATGSSPSPTPRWWIGRCCWPTNWSPTPWSTPAPRSGCGWSCAGTAAHRGAGRQPKAAAPGHPPTRKPRVDVGCG